MSEMDAYRQIFLEESAEYLQSITDGLLALECVPHDLEPVETVFRGAHSLKGMSAAMGYERTADLTHRMEGLMDRVRSREMPVTPQLVDLMLRAVDQVRVLIDDESSGKTEVDVGDLLESIEAATRGEAIEGSAPAAPNRGAAGAAPCELPGIPEGAAGSVADVEDDARLYRATVHLEGSCVLKAVRAYMVIKRLSHMGSVVDTVPSARDIEDERFESSFDVLVQTLSSANEVLTAVQAVSEVERAEVIEIARPAAEEVRPEAVESSGEREPAMRKRAAIPKLSETQTVRIAIGHLDTMVDLVGEIVTLRARLDELARRFNSKDLDEALEDLHRVSGELQHEVMQTRMVPVGNIFNRFPRMVRDLARDLGKEIEFELSGLDIELDRTVLDEIGDPIVHLLRNSVDHGIESAEARAAAGKPERGHIRLEAGRDRDMVKISVSDDGRGMDPDRIWEKAVALGLATEEERASCTLEDVMLFTCVPGFSTVKDATKVSGRGVGMDVVKGKIEHLGGTLSIVSRPGVGTTFTLSLPLTLAIMQAVLVGDGSQAYALPLASVDEVMAPADLTVETIENAPVVMLRDGEVVPLHRLDALMGSADPFELPRADEHIVLIKSGAHTNALTIQRLLGRSEIVIKPMSRVFREVRGLGGAAVLGDGAIALVLDPRTLFHAREEGVS